MKKFFEKFGTIAVVGASSKKYRTSYHIATYLQQQGYRVIPVNPNEKEVLGEVCYPSVFDIPDGISVDAIVIFRNKRFTEEMVQQIVEWCKKLKKGEKPVIWTQLDVSTKPAKKLAEKNGFMYIENRCIMVEHGLSLR